jgi:small subunit ribosomal protein S6
MRNYEIAFIADPEMDEQSLKTLEDKVRAAIESSGGQVTKVDPWGRRRLAYPIRKKNDGYYVFIEAELPPQAGKTLERDLRFNEQILRFMITSVEPAKTPAPKPS